MMLTNLADVARASGLPVVEVDGWRTRGHGEFVAVESITCHHTATSAAAAGDYPSLRIVRDGRSDLPGPLSNLGLGRNGTVYVIAAGYGYHAGTVHQTWMGNAYAIGIEAEHDGVSPWPVEQHAAYARLCAALCEGYGLPTARVLGHKEVAAPRGRKPDPIFDMAAFRSAVDTARDRMEDDPMADYAAQLDRIEKHAERAAEQAERARKGSYNRDLRLIALARETQADVDALLAQVDGEQ